MSRGGFNWALNDDSENPDPYNYWPDHPQTGNLENNPNIMDDDSPTRVPGTFNTGYIPRRQEHDVPPNHRDRWYPHSVGGNYFWQAPLHNPLMRNYFRLGADAPQVIENKRKAQTAAVDYVLHRRQQARNSQAMRPERAQAQDANVRAVLNNPDIRGSVNEFRR